ncbi:MAG: NAD(+) diphosphatase [Treponemataceae bacterium]
MINPRIDETIDLYFVFSNAEILVDENGNLPSARAIECFFSQQLISDWFTDSEYNFTALLLEDTMTCPLDYKWIPLHDFFASHKNQNELIMIASRAKTLLLWRKNTRFCGQCANPLVDEKTLLARSCSFCSYTVFPRISPAVIVLVTKGNLVLLAKHKNRTSDVYTCLAGFVESGETLEACVQREVKEECAIDVKNIQYVESQSWPYPDQLMIGFTAEWSNGDIVCQKDEIEDAQWFSKEKLPSIPPQGTIAYNLIQRLFTSQ